MCICPRGARLSSMVCLVWGAVIAWSLTSTLSSARDWDRKAAKKAFEEAKRLHFDLEEEQTTAPSREKYLECIRTYQKVYLYDPHFGESDDALYEAGKLYQEMGEKFGNVEYFKNAAKLFRFLLSEYAASRYCPDALLRLGDVYAGPLSEKSLAQEAYDQLRARFKSSNAAAALASRKSINRAGEPTAKQRSAAEPIIAASVHNIRHWSTSNYTRVVIDLDNTTRYQKTRLTDPDRIFFDIFSARLSPDMANKTYEVRDEFLKQVRVGQNRSDVVRVVLDFANIGDYSVFELHDPFRIIIDIHGVRSAQTKGSARTSSPKAEENVDSKTGAQAVATTPSTKLSATPSELSKLERTGVGQYRGQKTTPEVREVERSDRPSVKPEPLSAAATKTEDQKKATLSDIPPPPTNLVVRPTTPKPAAPTSRGRRTLTRSLGLKIGRIVLDPGHGGHDTGSIGRSGLKEKDLVLEVAHELQRLIAEKLGAEVVLTRKDDSFVPLEERTALANQHQADLFVSIHANSSNDRKASGVETYYLDFARSEDARAVAARENATTVRNLRDLQELVMQIAQADKSAESRELASMLQRKLYGGAHRFYPGTRNRGVRSAPFVVLIGANMPSVLVEVGFLSNPRDEKLLKRVASQQRLAEALFAGIEGYIKTLSSNVALNRSN